MATSGDYTYNATGNDIVTEALGLVGPYSPGESIDSTESADVLRTLNMMLKARQHRWGVWLNKELSLIMQNDTISYTIGPTGNGHCAENMVKTELAADVAASATTYTIDATTGMGDTFDRNGISEASTPTGAGSLTLGGALASSGVATLSSQRPLLIYSDGNDSGVTFGVTGQTAEGVAVTETITGPSSTTVYSSSTYKTVSAITISGAGTGNIEVGQVGDPVGIELDSDDMQWSYLSSALSTTITPVTAVSGAAATDNHVYSYTTKAQRPTLIIEARLHRSDDLERPIILVDRNEYMLLTNKTNEAPLNQMWYDKQRTNGVITVWPEPDSVQDWIKFSARFPIQDVDNLTDDIEVGQEWFEAIAWQLAIRIYPKYHAGKAIGRDMKADADEFLDEAMAADSENQPTYIQPSLRYGHR